MILALPLPKITFSEHSVADNPATNNPATGGGLKTLRFFSNDAFSIPRETPSLNIADWTFEELFDAAAMPPEERCAFAESGAFCESAAIAIHPGGWQSWSAGWELVGNERLPKKVALLPELKKLTNRDGELPPDNSGWITGHFIVYLRAGDKYLCIASMEGLQEGSGENLPPVSFYINRQKRMIKAEIYAPGFSPAANQVVAELAVFYARGFFAFKDSLKALYRQEKAFSSLDFLRNASGKKEPPGKENLPGGYASWYNHYNRINEKIILEDLKALTQTENLLKLRYIDRNRPLVFQIDDGWERAVGEWEIHSGRFPRGLKFIAEEIEAAGFIPGIWLAPFLVTKSSRIYREKPDWLLRETQPCSKGGLGKPSLSKPVVAGFNHLWDKQYYCLDISREDVLVYLKSIIDLIIDEWGFRYLKLDFLYAGVFSGAYEKSGAPHEHYLNACKTLTAKTQNAKNLPVGFLGCGLPLGLSYRFFPLSRTGADTREEWDWHLVRLLGHVGRPGAWINLRNTIGRTHLDGTVYVTDPDVIFLRSKNCKLKKNEKELIALVNFLLAGQIMFSDDPLYLKEEDLALTRRINALYEQLSGDEYGAVRISADVFRFESRAGTAVGLINLTGKAFRLERAQNEALYAAISAREILVDNRLESTAESVIFAPRSISIARL